MAAAAAVILLTLGGVWADSELRPRVAAIWPEEGASGVPARARIEMTFSTVMREETVEERLRIEPVVAGELAWEGNTLRFTPAEAWPSGGQVVVRLAEGARSRLGLAMAGEGRWTFEVGESELAYLWPAGGGADIYAIEPNSGKQRQLTSVGGVLDFDVAPDGLTLYYSAENPRGGSDLYALGRLSGESSPLLGCEAVTCRGVQISADGAKLAYERVDFERGEAEIWVVDLGSEAATQASEEGHETRLPRWSPQGLLSYYDATAGGYVVADLENGASWLVDNATGEAGDWAADGRTWVAPELLQVGVAAGEGEAEETLVLYASHLMAYEYAAGSARDLTSDRTAEDLTPSFSPDGARLAVGRKYIDEGRWTPGRQLWVMRADGREGRQITQAVNYAYQSFAWHPEGEEIACVRFNQTALTQPPELWLLTADGREAVRLVIGGYAPAWMP